MTCVKISLVHLTHSDKLLSLDLAPFSEKVEKHCCKHLFADECAESKAVSAYKGFICGSKYSVTIIHWKGFPEKVSLVSCSFRWQFGAFSPPPQDHHDVTCSGVPFPLFKTAVLKKSMFFFTSFLLFTIFWTKPYLLDCKPRLFFIISCGLQSSEVYSRGQLKVFSLACQNVEMTPSLSLATFCRPNSRSAFSSLQNHVHIRHRRDYDGQKSAVVVWTSLPGLPIKHEACYTRKYLRGWGNNLWWSAAYNRINTIYVFAPFFWLPSPRSWSYQRWTFLQWWHKSYFPGSQFYKTCETFTKIFILFVVPALACVCWAWGLIWGGCFFQQC